MKKATGVVRAIDPLGRVTLPMELRRSLGIEEKDPIEIFVDGQQIILQKYAPGCTLCGNTEGLDTTAKGKLICNDCVSGIVKTAKAGKVAAAAGPL